MVSYEEEAFRLLRDVRRRKSDLDESEQRLLTILGVRRQKPVYVRAVEWLLAALVEKPVARLVDEILKRLDKWRKHRDPDKF